MIRILVAVLALGLFEMECLPQGPAKDAETSVKVNPIDGFRKCQELIDDKIQKELMAKGSSEEEKFKKYLKCMYVVHRIMDEEGEVISDVLKAWFVCGFRSMKKGEAVYEKCVNKADTPEETAYGIHKCYRESIMKEMKKLVKNSGN